MATDVVTVEGEVLPTFGEVRIPREYVIAQGGREYILSDGLLVALGQLSRGHYDVDTAIVQLPTGENGQTAVVTARVTVFDPETGHVLRTASGIGDASPGNVGRMVTPHVLRMAETRALARALRHLLGLGMTALEELGQGAPEGGQESLPPTGGGNVAPAPASSTPGAGVEHILIGGKPYSRADVLAIYARRLEEARAAGLAVGEVDVVPPERAPLSALVAKSQEIKRRLEARSSAK
jgi:hypothetical protein